MLNGQVQQVPNPSTSVYKPGDGQPTDTYTQPGQYQIWANWIDRCSLEN